MGFGYSMCGVMLGLSLSAPYTSDVPLPLPHVLLSMATLCRCVLGFSLLLGVYYGVRVIEKGPFKEFVLAARLLRTARYASVPIVILLCAPALFLRLGI